MSKLTTKQRNSLPKSEFGLPGSRSFPVNDKPHAANAKARATQAVKAGRMAPATAAKIDAKANTVLGQDSDFGDSAMEPDEGSPAEEAQDAQEQAAAKKAAPTKKTATAPTAKAPMKAAPRLKNDPKDPDQDGEANPSKGKPSVLAKAAAFFARGAKKSGARLI